MLSGSKHTRWEMNIRTVRISGSSQVVRTCRPNEGKQCGQGARKEARRMHVLCTLTVKNYSNLPIHS